MSPDSWAQVRERLEGAGFALEGLDEHELRKALAPVLALARGLEHYAPGLLAKSRITIAVVGAEWLDALDSGRWYSLLGPLLGRDISVEGFLVGPQLESGSLEPVNSLVTSAPELTPVRETLQHFLENNGRGLDLAVLYQPGLDSDSGVLESPGPAPLLKAGVAVLGTSYSSDEFLMEREILRAFGYGCREPVDNPMALDMGREEARWGAVLWSLAPDVVPAGEPDRGAVDAVQRLSRMLAHSKLQGMLIPLERLGESLSMPRREGGARQMIYLFDAFYMAADTGEVFMVDGNRLRPTQVVVGAEAVKAYPAKGAAVIDRALWSAMVKERYLIGRDD